MYEQCQNSEGDGVMYECRRHKGVWKTPRAAERLKKLWTDNANTATTIADTLNEEFDMDISRNAVIGKAHRLGLPSRPSPIRQGGEKAKRLELQENRERYNATGHPRGHGGQVAPLADGPLPPAKVCQFPFGDVGEADFHFCGMETLRDEAGQAKSSYCAEHHRVCWLKPPQQGRAA